MSHIYLVTPLGAPTYRLRNTVLSISIKYSLIYWDRWWLCYVLYWVCLCCVKLNWGFVLWMWPDRNYWPSWTFFALSLCVVPIRYIILASMETDRQSLLDRFSFCFIVDPMCANNFCSHASLLVSINTPKSHCNYVLCRNLCFLFYFVPSKRLLPKCVGVLKKGFSEL